MATTAKTKRPVKTKSGIGAQFVGQESESRFSPLRDLSPERLVGEIEDFEAGRFRDLDRTMRAMERRDDIWKVSAAKARKDISRRKWECVPLEGYEGDPDAATQADKLKAFYVALRCVDWNCRNVGSGVRGLVDGMMRAYNDGYSVHEIVYEPKAGGRLGATAMRCPLSWFGISGGNLCLAEGRDVPVPLEEGGWLAARGDGVGIACAVAYMFKRLALGDWAVYSGRCGHPGIHGKTGASKGTPQWLDFVSALRKFGKEWSCATGLDDVIEKIDLSVSGTLPYPGLVERMDRAIASLQRGADLSTMSAGDGSGEGASLQGDESELIAADNCEMVTEALRSQVDTVVLAWHFGEGTEAKAGFRLVPPQRDTLDRDLKIDAQLVGQGVRLSKQDALSRYERREVDPQDAEDAPLSAPAAPAPAWPGSGIGSGLPNEAEPPTVADAVRLARSRDLAPVAARLARAEAATDPAVRRAELERLRSDLPGMLERLRAEDSAVLRAIAAAVSAPEKEAEA
jgi:hypothetical protein